MIVIIGVLAAFGVPKFLQSVEKSKAAEAFNYLSTVQSAQERYIAQNGVYADDHRRRSTSPSPPCSISQSADHHGDSERTGIPTWTLTLHVASRQPSYAMTVTRTQDGLTRSIQPVTTYPASLPVTSSPVPDRQQ